MNQRVLNKNGDIFVGDPAEKTLKVQVLLKEAILEIVSDDDDSNYSDIEFNEGR
jgi:hypothetical protein